MLNADGLFFDPEPEIKPKKKGYVSVEEEIIDMFLKLPKDRQRALLAELWSEFKPKQSEVKVRYSHIPF